MIISSPVDDSIVASIDSSQEEGSCVHVSFMGKRSRIHRAAGPLVCCSVASSMSSSPDISTSGRYFATELFDNIAMKQSRTTAYAMVHEMQCIAAKKTVLHPFLQTVEVQILDM